MTVGKKKEATPARSPASETTTQSGRKPWKKKTPVQILLDQVDKLREEISRDEELLNQKKEQLQKFEEARRLFEAK